MTTLVLGTPPPELQALIERRRKAGVDRLDEVWQGVRHLVPRPSFEHARVSQQLAELLGPLAIAAGLLATMSEFNLGESEAGSTITTSSKPDGGLALREGEYEHVQRSGLIELGPTDLAEQLDWPR